MDNKERNLFNGSLYCLNRSLKLIKVDTKYIISKGRVWIIYEVKTSELRGRGGAGFSTTGCGVGVTLIPPPFSKSPK